MSAEIIARADAAGRQAFLDGLSEADCPHREDNPDPGGDYWTSPAGLRQVWLRSWRTAWRVNQLTKGVQYDAKFRIAVEGTDRR